MVSVLSGLSEKNVRETCCIDVKTKEVQRERRVCTMTAAKSQGLKLLGKKKRIKMITVHGSNRGRKTETKLSVTYGCL